MANSLAREGQVYTMMTWFDEHDGFLILGQDRYDVHVADDFTATVRVSATPGPSAIVPAMLGLGIIGMGALCRRSHA